MREGPGGWNPAANEVSMVFLDRTEDQAADLSSLLAGVRKEMTGVKTCRTGLALLHLLRLAGFIPRGMDRLLRVGGPKVTAALSNVGVVFAKSELADEQGCLRAGSLVLKRIEPFAPIRRGVNAAVDVITYAGRLTFTMRYDVDALTAEGAGELLRRYVDCLRRDFV